MFTTVLVVLAALLVAAALFFATGGGGETPSQRKPLFLGLEPQLRAEINEGGPLYFASPFGDNGFWLDIEDHRIVAYVLVLPDAPSCTVKWKAQRDSYIDCNGDKVAPANLDQYTVTLRDKPNGERHVLVDLRKVKPAQRSSTST
jgi:hypothetical protein